MNCRVFIFLLVNHFFVAHLPSYVSLQDIVEALRALSMFFNDNSLRSRRNLRGDIEKRSLLISEQFETAFTSVKEVCILPHTLTAEQSCLKLKPACN
jgi:hypothetical protein